MRLVIDEIDIALQKAIDVAGLEAPFNTRTIDLQIDPATVGLTKGHPSENDPDKPLSLYHYQQAAPQQDQYFLPLCQPTGMRLVFFDKRHFEFLDHHHSTVDGMRGHPT